jgi:signal transduction histidine kinase
MPDLRAARQVATSWRGDAVLAALVAVWTLPFFAVQRPPAGQLWSILTVVPLLCAATAIRGRWSLCATGLCCVAVLALTPLPDSAFLNGPVNLAYAAVLFLICCTVGARVSTVPGLAAVVALTISLEISDHGFNPILVVITVGPWIVGRVVLSRRQLAEQLAARNVELAAEQELFAAESVRYERVRIARELHDIVAHCLSVMVVQAGAGQRIAADSDGMAEVLGSVAEVAAQAQEEIARLVELLSGKIPVIAAPAVQLVGELVTHAASTGLQVSYRMTGQCDALSPATSEVAYRVVQEALTNALKHAPGAPVTVALNAEETRLLVEVTNAAGTQPVSWLDRAGGGHGLAGMRERVLACGGTLTAGPANSGGWQVSALLPIGLY